MDDIYKYRNFTAELCPLPCRDNTSVLTSNFDTVGKFLIFWKFSVYIIHLSIYHLCTGFHP